MQFYEKLIFLQNLTQVTNRMLAHEIQVDPSQISRLRTGARGIPRNRDLIKAMSSYFAKRCNTEYQRQALSGMLGIKQALTLKKDQLSEILYYWLCGESAEVGRFIRTFESLTFGDPDAGIPEDPFRLNIDNAVYYGNDGKRSATRTVYQHLLSMEKPCTIYILSDEADDWISEDIEFSRSLQAWGLNLLHRGFKILQIVPPAAPSNLAFESLTRWLPLYMTFQVTAYFYPRLRDSLHRRTLIVVPGEITMTSNSAAHQTISTETMLTTDTRLTLAYASQFQDYISLCRPMQIIYTESQGLMYCFTSFLSFDGDRIQKLPSLSAETAPPELMAYCTEKQAHPDLLKLGNLYLQELALSKGSSKPYVFIDLVYLASAEDVKSGKVPILLSYTNVDSPPLYYTSETYILHLKNILDILDTYDNYHFVPINPRAQKEGTLMVKDGHRVLLVRGYHPVSVLEISQPEMIQLCQEYLYKMAEQIGYSGMNRAKIISQIKKRIREPQV